MKPGERRQRLDAARLYLVCDADRPDLDEFLDAVLRGGVDVLQLRDKEAEARPLLRAAERFATACERHGALFVVNDRVDVALAAGADGVHLGQDDLDPGLAREIAGDDLLIGRSTHSIEQARAALGEPVDYFCAGPVFETPTKPGRPATGTALLAAVAADRPALPWFAIGGIDDATVSDVVAAGAARIVVVRALTRADDPARVARDLLDAL